MPSAKTASTSEGLIRAQNVLETTVETWGRDGAAADCFENFFLDRYRQAYVDEMKHFADVIAGRPPLVGVADGVAALALAEAAARSVESGRFETVEGAAAAPNP